MAINENIVTGRKFRKLVDEANKLWQRISFWSKASDVEFDDGSNAETKLGAINGVTDSLTSTASNIAASAAAVKALNDKITELNSNLSGMHKVFMVANGTNMKKLLPDHYKELTINNFYVFPPASSSNGNRLGNVSGTEGNPYLAVSFNSGTFSYNPDTGIFSLGNGNAVANYDLGYKTMTTAVVYSKAICVYPSI